jgi:hypothetical protein
LALAGDRRSLLMRRAFGLAIAMQRFELRLLLGGALVLVVVGLGLAWQIRAARAEELECYRSAPPPVEGFQGDICPETRPRLEILETGATFMHVGAIATPFVLGLFLGAPVVAREVEAKTAAIAWSLSLSRRRWLVRRAAPIFLLVATATLAVGIVGDVLTHAMPWAEGSAVGFADYGARGPLLAVRGVAVFCIALALGTLVPRQLPALLLAGAMTLALFAAITLFMDDLMRREAVPLTSQEQQQGASQKVYDSAIRVDATGELISYEELYRDHPEAVEGEWPAGFTPMVYAVPGSRYGDFVLRESAILGAAALLTLGTTAVVVGRRRP